MIQYSIIENGTVSTPEGYKASGIKAGLKKSGALDMALIISDTPATAAGTFTSSSFPAAPVQLDRKLLLEHDTFRAVIINSGNANACTGKQGYADAVKMTEKTSQALGVSAEEVLVSSTGRIGTPMPMDIIENGIELAAEALSENGGTDAAQAIMTTDTVPKQCAVSVKLKGKTVQIGGICKGAGMIAPKMTVPHATMLAYITTDAGIAKSLLSSLIAEAVEFSFNRITVDGDMSTNDTVLMLANSASGVEITADTEEYRIFRDALTALTQKLAKAIVHDAEGATKFVTVKVKNAPAEEDAEMCAAAIANSMLCKTAWFGGDPNWGRILAAAGYSGAEFAADKVDLFYDDLPVVLHGEDAGTPEPELEKVLLKNSFTVTLNLNSGSSDYEMWTNDISYEYVKINAEYHT